MSMARRPRARREALLRRGQSWVEQATRPLDRELGPLRTIMDRALVRGTAREGHEKAADGWTEADDRAAERD